MDSSVREFWNLFFVGSDVGIWAATLKRPMPGALPVHARYAHLSRYAVMACCNNKFAGMFGFQNPRALAGLPLSHLFAPHNKESGDPIADFIAARCQGIQGSISQEVGPAGGLIFHEHHWRGLFRKNSLTTIWGIRRAISEEQFQWLTRKRLVASLPQHHRVILEMTIRGSTLKEIGGALCVSLHTIESYRKRILNKLGLSSVAELIRQATVLGLDTANEGDRLAETLIASKFLPR